MVKKRSIAALLSIFGGVGIVLGLAGPAHAFTQRGVGVVTALRGQVAVAHAPEVAARERRPGQESLKFRDDVFFRDTIDTQRESTARMLLRGRAVFTVRELSRVQLEEGVIPADPTRTRSIVSLLTGALRAIVQRDIRPQDELELQTPNAISAVRGSEISAVTGLPNQIPPADLQEALGLLPPGTPPPRPDEQVSFFWIREAQGDIINPTAPGRPAVSMANNVFVAVIGARPPILVALAVPDLVARVMSRFVISVVTGPLGAHQARNVSGAQGQAAADGAAGAPSLGALGPSSIERAIDTGTQLNNATLVTTFTYSGTAFQPATTLIAPFTASFSGSFSGTSVGGALGGGFDGSFTGTNAFTGSNLGAGPGPISGSGTVYLGAGFTGKVTFTMGGPFVGSFSGTGTFTPTGSSGSATGSLTSPGSGTSKITFTTK